MGQRIRDLWDWQSARVQAAGPGGPKVFWSLKLAVRHEQSKLVRPANEAGNQVADPSIQVDTEALKIALAIPAPAMPSTMCIWKWPWLRKKMVASDFRCWPLADIPARRRLTSDNRP